MPIRIQNTDFDLSTEVAQLRHGNSGVGATVSFIGTVRDMNQGDAVTVLELEHYPGMTEKALETIVMQARERWPIIDVTVIHRIGPLQPCDQIVLVAVIATHRGDAFSACEFIIDFLKTQAPFWKKEQTLQGTRWVDARAADDNAMARWNQ
jgi:molybdopterin synthase catalytic subunit